LLAAITSQVLVIRILQQLMVLNTEPMNTEIATEKLVKQFGNAHVSTRYEKIEMIEVRLRKGDIRVGVLGELDGLLQEIRVRNRRVYDTQNIRHRKQVFGPVL